MRLLELLEERIAWRFVKGRKRLAVFFFVKFVVVQDGEVCLYDIA